MLFGNLLLSSTINKELMIMQLSIKNCPVASRQIKTPLSAIASSKQCLGKRQRGVTLIELMIIIIILAILAAIVFPYYGDYIMKAKLAESQVLFSGIKTTLGTYYHEKGHFPEDEMTFNQLELVTSGNDVMETRYYADPMNPRIEMTIAGFPEMENTIAWQWFTDWDPSGMMKHRWSCKPQDSGTMIQFKYLPSPCRD